MQPGVSDDNQADAPPVLSVTDLAFAYGQGDGAADVFAGVTAAARPGALTVLLGPNAAGKTTLLRAMLGQLTPRRGTVELLGRPINQWSAGERAAVMSFVPQRASVAFAYTVRDVIALGRHALPRDDAAVDAALDATQTADLADRSVQELSVGQQQRVLLARAMAQAAGRGRAMLLDEPVSAMDPLHAHRVMGLLREQAAAGLAVVVVLHDLNLACRYADDAWLLHGGRLVAAGPWDQVFTEQRLAEAYGLPFSVAGHDDVGRPVWHAEPKDAARLVT